MKVSIISFSINGANIAKKIYEEFNSEWEICAATTNERASHILPKLDGGLTKWVEEQFVSCDLLIFVGACGIAVRHIAPYIVSKQTDPAVLVVDDTGKNVISLLSGHIGGANEFAKKVALSIGAYPVITTSSDCNGKIAIDMFAKKNELLITDFKMAKEIESALLDGEKIGLFGRFETEGNIPGEFELISGDSLRKFEVIPKDALINYEAATEKYRLPKYGVIISDNINEVNLFEKTLYLVPQNVVVGVGCRRGKSKEEILDCIYECLKNKGLRAESVCKICSIDLKKDEQGLLDAANEIGAKTDFFSAEELSKVTFISSSSEFVKSVTGVDNVCERAAVIGADNGKVILAKTKFDGVTIAFAIKERRICFE